MTSPQVAYGAPHAPVERSVGRSGRLVSALSGTVVRRVRAGLIPTWEQVIFPRAHNRQANSPAVLGAASEKPGCQDAIGRLACAGLPRRLGDPGGCQSHLRRRLDPRRWSGCLQYRRQQIPAGRTNQLSLSRCLHSICWDARRVQRNRREGGVNAVFEG